MNKTIILLSGTPSKFIEETKKISWVRNVNFKGFLGAKANGFSGEDENEEYNNFICEFVTLVNKYFNAEEVYLKDKIEKFLQDDSKTKINGGKVFDNFVLFIHDASKELTDMLQSEYGIFTLHISRRDLNSNIELYDNVLYEDDEDFENQVTRVIGILTNTTQKENV